MVQVATLVIMGRIERPFLLPTRAAFIADHMSPRIAAAMLTRTPFEHRSVVFDSFCAWDTFVIRKR